MLHLFYFFFMICTMMHGSMNIKFITAYCQRGAVG
jgi:hypothetical protein